MLQIIIFGKKGKQCLSMSHNINISLVNHVAYDFGLNSGKKWLVGI
jgi:hypothetical protein